MPKKRVHVYYKGMVHGIGFRFTVEYLVRQMNGVAGWVKNLPDGRVELLCEGKEDTLIELLKKVRNSPLKSYIRDTDVSWSEPTGEFKKFDIRFW